MNRAKPPITRRTVPFVTLTDGPVPTSSRSPEVHRKSHVHSSCKIDWNHATTSPDARLEPHRSRQIMQYGAFKSHAESLLQKASSVIGGKSRCGGFSPRAPATTHGGNAKTLLTRVRASRRRSSFNPWMAFRSSRLQFSRISVAARFFLVQLPVDSCLEPGLE